MAPTSFPASFSWRCFHLLQILKRTLFSGHQGYYSSSSEACQDYLKLNSFTLSPSFTAYFICKFYLTNHHSSQVHAIHGMSCLLLTFLSPTTCPLSNLRSIYLILSLLLAVCFLLPLLGLCIGHHGLSST